MGSTEIPVHRTIAEVQGVLLKVGARQISQDYANKSGEPSIVGMSFCIDVNGAPLLFNLPVRTGQVFLKLQSMRSRNREKFESKDRESAQRIAWRQLLRWVEAQMAMIDAGMALTHEVFMPYAVDRHGRTAFEVWSNQLALPAAKET